MLQDDSLENQLDALLLNGLLQNGLARVVGEVGHYGEDREVEFGVFVVSLEELLQQHYQVFLEKGFAGNGKLAEVGQVFEKKEESVSVVVFFGSVVFEERGEALHIAYLVEVVFALQTLKGALEKELEDIIVEILVGENGEFGLQVDENFAANDEGLVFGTFDEQEDDVRNHFVDVKLVCLGQREKHREHFEEISLQELVQKLLVNGHEGFDQLDHDLNEFEVFLQLLEEEYHIFEESLLELLVLGVLEYVIEHFQDLNLNFNIDIPFRVGAKFFHQFNLLFLNEKSANDRWLSGESTQKPEFVLDQRNLLLQIVCLR